MLLFFHLDWSPSFYLSSSFVADKESLSVVKTLFIQFKLYLQENQLKNPKIKHQLKKVNAQLKLKNLNGKQFIIKKNFQNFPHPNISSKVNMISILKFTALFASILKWTLKLIANISFTFYVLKQKLTKNSYAHNANT